MVDQIILSVEYSIIEVVPVVAVQVDNGIAILPSLIGGPPTTVQVLSVITTGGAVALVNEVGQEAVGQELGMVVTIFIKLKAAPLSQLHLVKTVIDMVGS